MNKTIAKNTIILYSRSIVNLVLGLVISRLTLEALGVGDYGIQSVVGSLVSMLSILNSSLNAAISRYITISVGKGDCDILRRLVGAILFLLLLFSFFIFIVAESAGLYMLKSYISIPLDRWDAALFVYQISILMFILGMVSVLYSSILSAYEKFSSIATIEIITTVIRCIFAFSLAYTSYDKLIYLSTCSLVLSAFVFIAYYYCCKKIIPRSLSGPKYSKEFIKQLIPFYSWNLFGSIAWVLKSSGMNVLINMFFGVTLNAAQGIAMQVSNSVSTLVGCFTAAVQPQITKKYAVSDYSDMWKLVFSGTRYAILLLSLISLPIIFNMEFLLSLWLKTVPNEADLLAIFLIINILFETLSVYIITVLLATGKIAFYQVSVGLIMLLNIPLSYIAFKNGCPPVTYVYISIFITIVAFLMRIIILKRLLCFSLVDFLCSVVFKTLSVILCSSLLLAVVKALFNGSFLRSILSLILASIINTVVIFLFGFTREEKADIIHHLVSKIKTFAN